MGGYLHLEASGAVCKKPQYVHLLQVTLSRYPYDRLNSLRVINSDWQALISPVQVVKACDHNLSRGSLVRTTSERFEPFILHFPKSIDNISPGLRHLPLTSSVQIICAVICSNYNYIHTCIYSHSLPIWHRRPSLSSAH